MLIGLYGGTFDPVHMGHINAASAVKQYLGLDEVRLVLNAQPAHKQAECVSSEHRWAMLNSACANRAGLVADNTELLPWRPILYHRHTANRPATKSKRHFMLDRWRRFICNTTFLASLARLCWTIATLSYLTDQGRPWDGHCSSPLCITIINAFSLTHPTVARY